MLLSQLPPSGTEACEQAVVISSFSTAGSKGTCLKLYLSKQYCLSRYFKEKKKKVFSEEAIYNPAVSYMIPA